MQIIHVVDSMDPATGGPAAVISRLAAAQRAILGGDGRVLVVSHDCLPQREKEMAASLNGVPGIGAVGFVTVPRLGPVALGARSRLREVFREVSRGSTAVHLHGVWDQLLLMAAKEARRASVPYFITPHGMLDPWALNQGRWKKKLALAVAFRRLLNNAACLHLLNRDEADLMRPLRLAASTHVIPNGVFLDEIEPLPVRGTFSSAHPELVGKPYILFLSRLHFKKGLDFLATAFAQVASRHERVQLVVAGPNGGARIPFEKQVRDLGVSQRVHLMGPVYGRDKYAALVDAACFCLPSRQEGFSIAILEAIACGTPVVISENCHFPEIAEVGAGEVVPLTSDKIAAALERVIANTERREQMGRAGRELVRSRYTWPVIAKQTLEMYRRK